MFILSITGLVHTRRTLSSTVINSRQERVSGHNACIPIFSFSFSTIELSQTGKKPFDNEQLRHN